MIKAEIERIQTQNDDLLAACEGVEYFATTICHCPFCNGYAGFTVEDEAYNDGGPLGHDDDCPWPLVWRALRQARRQE